MSYLKKYLTKSAIYGQEATENISFKINVFYSAGLGKDRKCRSGGHGENSILNSKRSSNFENVVLEVIFLIF